MEHANEFCRRLSLLPREKRAGRFYRLPTEAEWEFACRAETTTMYSFGDDESLLIRYAWTEDTGGRTTHPAGTKIPNPFCLHDMHGNVWEWCSDWYAPYPSGGGEVMDPTGADRGSWQQLVLRWQELSVGTPRQGHPVGPSQPQRLTRCLCSVWPVGGAWFESVAYCP
ncbi:MAG: formylglycine-generating enzyme family protein [Planctomycetota bacterium]|nr:formylglycine-generating enzyme family protein [Planctomycetota bacterium]